MKEQRFSKIADVLVEYIREHKHENWQTGLIKGISMRTGCKYNGKRFTGLNIILTYMYIDRYGYDSNIFLTYREVQNLGGYVKAGAKGQPILRANWGWLDKNNKYFYRKGWSRKDYLEAGCKEQFFGWQVYNEFNISQTSLEYEAIKASDIVFQNRKASEIVEGYLAAGGAEIMHESFLECPCYIPTLDRIEIFPQDHYTSEANYYSPLFHEMVHSTGAEQRLDRVMNTDFDSKEYREEEIIAELGSSMLMVEAGFDESEYLDNNTAYTAHWLERLEADADAAVLEIQRCFTKAFAAKEYILGAR